MSVSASLLPEVPADIFVILADSKEQQSLIRLLSSGNEGGEKEAVQTFHVEAIGPRFVSISAPPTQEPAIRRAIERNGLHAHISVSEYAHVA
jgi:hypothetical protein